MTVQTSAREGKALSLVDVDLVIARLRELAKGQQAAGHIGRASGVRSAIQLLKRDKAALTTGGADMRTRR